MAKKKVEATRTVDLRVLIDPEHEELSLSRQCKLLGLSSSSYYYQPALVAPIQDKLIHAINVIYTKHPYYGSRRIVKKLRREGWMVGRKRVRRLMRLMGIQAIYQKPNTSKPNLQHKIYPYLLRDVKIDHINQVWSTDITYIRLKTGWVYLMAVIDWHSRKVLSWGLSNTMDTSFCIDVLENSFKHGKPEVFNTDQGSQYTSNDFTGVLKRKGIKISMDGKGRYLDNILVERLWRTVKYEDVFINDYQTLVNARKGLEEYFITYNTERLHQSLDYHTPDEVWSYAAGEGHNFEQHIGDQSPNPRSFTI